MRGRPENCARYAGRDAGSAGRVGGSARDVVQDTMKAEAIVIVAGVTRILASHAQDEIRTQVAVVARDLAIVYPQVAQDEMDVAGVGPAALRVEVDLHQLELWHDDLRSRGGDRRRLIASVAELGQQVG